MSATNGGHLGLEEALAALDRVGPHSIERRLEAWLPAARDMARQDPGGVESCAIALRGATLLCEAYEHLQLIEAFLRELWGRASGVSTDLPLSARGSTASERVAAPLRDSVKAAADVAARIGQQLSTSIELGDAIDALVNPTLAKAKRDCADAGRDLRSALDRIPDDSGQEGR